MVFDSLPVQALSSTVPARSSSAQVVFKPATTFAPSIEHDGAIPESIGKTHFLSVAKYFSMRSP